MPNPCLRCFNEFGEGILQSMKAQSSFCPRLDCDLDSLALETVAKQTPGDMSRPQVFVGGGILESLAFCSDLAELKVIVLSVDVEQALVAGRALGPGRVISLGAQSYSQQDRDELRRTQRLMPGFELDFSVAVQSAVAECEGSKVLVALDLRAFVPWAVPELAGTSPLGLEPSVFLDGLKLFGDADLAGFHILGDSPCVDPGGRTSALGAEILRDSLLAWWADGV